MVTELEVDVGQRDEPGFVTVLPGLEPSRCLADHYELLQSRLGHGDFAEVRLGLRKERLSERVAVKVISKTNALAHERLQAEVEILRAVAALNHPNLVRLLDAFETPTHIYLVFELLSRGTLLNYVATFSGKALPEKEARRLLRDIASGLAALHKMGIVHRDLKLQNIMLDESNTAKICDFGFAKRASAADISNLETARFVSPCGTPGFVAPEVLGHQGYDYSADLWSLGIVAFVLLTGRPPFDKEASADRPRVASAEPPTAETSQPPTASAIKVGTGSGKPRRRSVVSASPLVHAKDSVPQANPRWTRMAGSEVDSGEWGRSHRLSAEEPDCAQNHNESPANSPLGPRSAFGLLARMRNGWRFPKPAPGEPEVSEGAKTLVFALLTENPTLRLTAERALQHAWLSPQYDDDSESPPRVCQRLRSLSSPTFSAASRGAADLQAIRDARLMRRGADGAAVAEAAPSQGATSIGVGGSVLGRITTRSSQGYRDPCDEDEDEDDDPPFRPVCSYSYGARPMHSASRGLLPMSDAEDSEPEIGGENDSPASGMGLRRPVPAARDFGRERPPAIQRRRR